MQFFKINKALDDEYSACMQIYHQSFPDNERQPTYVIKQRVNNGVATLYGGRLDGVTICMCIIFNLKDKKFQLLDYFAVSKTGRGKGIGSLLLKYATDRAVAAGKQLILEVEDPAFGDNRHERSKRIEFYEKAGAVIVEDLPYLLPPMVNGDSPTEMKLMTMPGMITKDQAIKLVVDIYAEVYGRGKDDPLLRSILK